MFAGVAASDLQALADEDLTGLPGSVLGEQLLELRRTIGRLELEFSRRLAPFALQRGYAEEGACTIVSWLRWRCRLTPGAASQRVELANHLPQLPGTTRALAAGEIGYQDATAITRAAEEVGPEAVAKAEPVLLEAARRMDPVRLRMVTRHLRYCADPDGALRDANLAHERRHLYLNQTWEGLFAINGLLDPEGGATLQTALNALLGPPEPGDERSAAQRRADGLVELARQRLDAGDLPEVGGQRPHLTVTAPLATLRREPQAPAGELEWAEPIPAETVRRLACDASLNRVLLGPESEPIEVGRASRTIPPALRRALVVRDKGCRFPGCDRPPAWTDGHHLTHWADGGETNLANVVLICRRHHRRIHEEGWQLARGEDGALVAIQPWWTRTQVGHSQGLAPPLAS